MAASEVSRWVPLGIARRSQRSRRRWTGGLSTPAKPTQTASNFSCDSPAFLKAVRAARPSSFCEALNPTLRGFERSEEHTSELQSRLHLVCRLLLEKKK